MQSSTQSVNKIDCFFLARNANARRHLMWESEQNSMQGGRHTAKG